MKFVCCPVSVVPEDLDIVEHHFDDFLSLVQFTLDLVAVGLSILKKLEFMGLKNLWRITKTNKDCCFVGMHFMTN